MMCVFVFFFKQKTAYELRISDWSSDVCSSDLLEFGEQHVVAVEQVHRHVDARRFLEIVERILADIGVPIVEVELGFLAVGERLAALLAARREARSEEHTSELQSLMRISYAVFCLKKKRKLRQHAITPTHTNNYNIYIKIK